MEVDAQSSVLRRRIHAVMTCVFAAEAGALCALAYDDGRKLIVWLREDLESASPEALTISAVLLIFVLGSGIWVAQAVKRWLLRGQRPPHP